MEEEVEVSLPCRKGDYDLIGSGEIKWKKPKTWNAEPLGMPQLDVLQEQGEGGEYPPCLFTVKAKKAWK